MFFRVEGGGTGDIFQRKNTTQLRRVEVGELRVLLEKVQIGFLQ